MTDFPTLIREVRANWLTIADAADEYDLQVKYLRRLIEERKVRNFRLDGRYMIDPESLDAFLTTILVEPVKTT
jgi:hypothetical protein